jgi:hypothetical protein
MAKLTAEERKLLDELSAKEAAEDEDDFEIEIYDTGKGKGARIPFSRGRAWLYSELGIGEDPNPKADPKAGAKGDAGKGDEGDGAAAPRQGYFGRQQAS